jgi:dipeptidyl aminopeptidase/acylaminoacyl peptidase
MVLNTERDIAMSYATQRVELCSKEGNQPAKLIFRISPGLSQVSILLLIVCSTYGFCIPRAEETGSVARSNQPMSENAAVKRPVTVADSIQMTRLGDPLYSKGLVAKFSPDAKRFVVVLRKGNLETNTNEYSLTLFETDEIFHSPTPHVLLSIASSSNRPAIHNVIWMEDNNTIMFLGEHPGEITQLYSLKCSSKELKKLTNHATNLSSFAVGANGGDLVFSAENPSLSFVNEDSARQGINVTSESLSDLIAGKRGLGYDDYTLFIRQAGSEAETRITTEGRVLDNEISLSPDGLHVVVRTEATHVPDTWSEYDDQFLKASSRHSALGARTTIFQYEVVDTRTGASRLLLDAPISPLWGSEVAWSPNSQSVIVSDMYLPLNIDDPAERARRKAQTFLTEVDISSRQLVKISDEDLRLLYWDAKTNEVVCDFGRLDSFNGKATRKVYFRKGDATWSRSSIPQEQAKASPSPSLPDIVVKEDMNHPPRIFAVDSGTGQKSLLMDLNPQFEALALARVEEVTWETSHHVEVKAGLYWPVNYVAGKKYPLVIQTHAWDPSRFWIDGPWTTAFAAQALAGKGFFVLQVPDPDGHLWDTPKEVPAAMATYDAAIDLLERRGLINLDRIGITGFSRTFLYVTYTLTHSKHHFAAADITDGVDDSYFQYMVSSNYFPGMADEFDRLTGAPPFGKGLHKWLKVSPAFLMDRIETPVRIQALGPDSLVGDWHWFSGLTRLGKPVALIYIPGGDHILEKPWDRMISQQGNVDWFCFWLKGEEDPDPAKAGQYKRWHDLRALDTKSGASVEAQ